MTPRLLNDGATSQPSQALGSPTGALLVESVLELLVEAVWADVMGEIDSDGQVPCGTEPKPEAHACTA